MLTLQDIVTDLKLESDSVRQKLPVPQFPVLLEIITRLLSTEGGFEILLVGERGSRKSSFGNVLLGKQVFPEYSMPCTSVCTKVTYGSKPEGYLIKKGNVHQEIPGLEVCYTF